MAQSSLELLEFRALKDLIGREISTAAAARKLDELFPSTDSVALTEALQEVAEAMSVVPESEIRFRSLPDVEVATARLRLVGSSLEGQEIYELMLWLDRASSIRTALYATGKPSLLKRAARLTDFRGILRELGGKVLPGGGLTDDASVALHRIRRSMEKQKRAIQESLERFLLKHRDEGIVREEFVTIRNERFVVPLIASQRRKLDGVIHAASGTGATLFVEPMETVDLNNDLVRLTEEEMREVHRILLEMTAALREHTEPIRRTIATMAELELVFAKARFALKFRCAIPAFGSELELLEARHPVLDDVLQREGRAIVPISLRLDPDRRTLLISGPNTGGKTVTMKTVGLLSMMAQSAIPVPCSKAVFPIFDRVLADIGDNQSIEESLSSFSAHIGHVASMLFECTQDSLVLLDELGRATDPEEGGALGVAMLERFRECGAFTLASTHLMALKVYGAATQGVVQASMGFDEETFTPTYRLQVGVPGRSAGLAIAAKLGLPQSLLDRAKQSMSTSERDIALFIGELQQRLVEVRRQHEDLERDRATLQREMEREREQTRKAEQKRIEEMDRQASDALQRFEVEAQKTIATIRESAGSRKAADQAARKVARTSHSLTARMEEAKRSAEPTAPPPPKISEGDRVRLRGIRELSRVRRIVSAEEIEVEAGFLKMRVPMADVAEVLPPGATAKLPSGITFQQGPTWNTVTREINVIGHRAEEAIAAVEKFLDTAALASVDRVRIVHGHGMGVLKRSVADLLRGSPHVARFYSATPAEGGNGATIAELREN